MITPEYKAELLALHTNYSWGTTAGKYAGDSIVSLLKEHPEIRTILDYGCGSGTLEKSVIDRGVSDREWVLYDPCVVSFNKMPTGKFDLVITTDVLEHVEEVMLNKVFHHLRSLTGKFLYNEIACYLTNVHFASGPYRGKDLHISLKAPDAWKIRLRHEGFTTVKSKVSLLEGWKVRYLLIQERIENEGSDIS